MLASNFVLLKTRPECRRSLVRHRRSSAVNILPLHPQQKATRPPMNADRTGLFPVSEAKPAVGDTDIASFRSQ
jgi:hypothetical protein